LPAVCAAGVWSFIGRFSRRVLWKKQARAALLF
jgi:hypothetical protein